jgi:hypothetical protein
MGGIKALRKVQMGPEATSGTAVLATAIMRMTGTLEDQRQVKHADEDVGYISPVDRAFIPKVEAQIELAGEATFEQLPYALAAGIKNVTTGVADGAGSGKIYAYPLPTTTLPAIKTRTLECGDNQQMERAEYAFLEELTLTGKAGEVMKMKHTWRPRQASINQYKASTIAFVAATKKITDTANGLAGFTTGMAIMVTGSASNDGTYTVATGGVAGEIVVNETMVNESLGASVTLEQTFTVIATLPTVEEILFQLGKLYIDDVGGTLGGTQKSLTFLEMNLKVTTGWQADFTGDGFLYFSKVKMDKPSAKLDITFEHDGSSVAEKINWRNKLSRKIRLKFEGSSLATAGTNYSKKTLLVDMAGKWEKFDALDDLDGNDVVKGSFLGAYNSTAGLYATLTVVNELSTLP